jgi:DNA-directed RNA polymerase II subunit RPB2
MLGSKYCYLSEKKRDDFPYFGECPYDNGGYFIINGAERVAIIQERNVFNQVYIVPKQGSKNSYVAEIRSSHPSQKNMTALYVKKGKYSGNSVTTFYLVASTAKYEDEIPISLIFKALGWISDLEITQGIVGDLEDKKMVQLLQHTLALSPCVDQDTAQATLGQHLDPKNTLSPEKKASRVSEFLRNDFLPHLGNEPMNFRKKAVFFAHMTRQLLGLSLFFYSQILQKPFWDEEQQTTEITWLTVG